MPRTVRWIGITKMLIVTALIALVGMKVTFHDWVCATLCPRCGDFIVMKVKRVPCQTGADLQPGHVKVYAYSYGNVKYFEFKFGRKDYRKILVPLIPPRITSPYVTVTGNLIQISKMSIKAPFKVIVLNANPRIYVDQYEIKVNTPCKILLEPNAFKFFPPVFIVDGKATRYPNNVSCQNVAIIMPYSMSVTPGKISSTTAVSVVSVSAKELKVNTISIYAPKGITIKWEPLNVLTWTSYADIMWRWPYWPYSL